MTQSPDHRAHLAEEFLREAVFRSRAGQAASAGLAGARLAEPAGPGRCGLGERPALELDVSERGARIVEELFGGPLDGSAHVHTAHLRAAMGAWIEVQDTLDRKRNHFLRDFRAQHGFDRNAYTPEVLSRYEQGLERIHGEASARLTEAARALLAGT